MRRRLRTIGIAILLGTAVPQAAWAHCWSWCAGAGGHDHSPGHALPKQSGDGGCHSASTGNAAAVQRLAAALSGCAHDYTSGAVVPERPHKRLGAREPASAPGAFALVPPRCFHGIDARLTNFSPADVSRAALARPLRI